MDPYNLDAFRFPVRKSCSSCMFTVWCNDLDGARSKETIWNVAKVWNWETCFKKVIGNFLDSEYKKGIVINV